MALTNEQKDLVKRFCDITMELENELSKSEELDEVLGEAIPFSRADMRDLVWHIEEAMKGQ